MHQNYDINTKVGLLSGIFGGIGKYFLQIHSENFLTNFMQAIFTAFMCGIAGVLGKEIFTAAKKALTKKKAFKITTRKKVIKNDHKEII